MKTELPTLAEPQEAEVSTSAVITMQVWAIPLGFKIFGQEVGEHTWVASDTRYCESCRFGVILDNLQYCSLDRWSSGYYSPPTSNSRRIRVGSASNTTASCIAGAPYKYLGIPAQSGIVYGINGVCQQLVNRILYPSGVTSAGARGYWFTQLIYGTYATMVPWVFIPPWSPLWPVAVAVQANNSTQWAQIRGRCVSSSTMVEAAGDAGGRYLQAVQQLQAEPLLTQMPAQWTAQAFSDMVDKQYQRHMQEIDLTLGYRGSGISSSKLADLRSLWSEFHKPSPELAAAAEEQLKVPGQYVSLASADALLVAQQMDEKAGEMLKKVIEVLGPEDFETFFEHKPDAQFLVIDPRMLGYQS